MVVIYKKHKTDDSMKTIPPSPYDMNSLPLWKCVLQYFPMFTIFLYMLNIRPVTKQTSFQKYLFMFIFSGYTIQFMEADHMKNISMFIVSNLAKNINKDKWVLIKILNE